MNKDNIQELLKPRYKVIADYPYSIHKIGTIIQNEGQDWIDKVRYYKCANFPHLFRRLEWWDDRDVKDMPEYVKHGENGKIRKVEKYIPMHGGDMVVEFDGGRQRGLNHKWLPATKTEYLNQTNQP